MDALPFGDILSLLLPLHQSLFPFLFGILFRRISSLLRHSSSAKGLVTACGHHVLGLNSFTLGRRQLPRASVQPPGTQLTGVN